MRKERLTIEELQAMPKEAFPLTVECDDHGYAGRLKRITILSPVLADSHLAAIDAFGELYIFYSANLYHYPSLKPEAKKVKWYRVTAWKKGIRVPNEDYALFRDEQDFLSRYRLEKENFHFIELKEVGEWEDFEEVK